MLSVDKKSGPSTIYTKAALSVIFSLLTFAGLQLTASTVVDGRFLYDPASVPFFAEILKLVISVFMAASTVRSACFEMVSRETVWLYAPPAFLFWISNNARMLSYQYLEPPVLHLLSNLRITFTAILMWLCLKRQFTRVQWLAIFLLPVSMIVSNYKAPLLQAARFTPGTAAARGYVLAVISAAASSGSIVYTEWSLKSTTSSIHVQNAQLYSWGVIVNLVYFYFRGSSGHPLFKLSHGFTILTWVCVLHAACCGFIVAAILKYADAILKAYSTCGAMILTSLFSAAALRVAVPIPLMCGMLLASGSVLMFYVDVKAPIVCTQQALATAGSVSPMNPNLKLSSV